MLVSCGVESSSGGPAVSSSQPVLMAAVPDSGSASGAATIVLQGIGFSPVPPENIVLVGNVTVVGEAYQLIPSGELPANGAVETLTFTVPSGAAPGTGSLLVIVGNSPSNGIDFTVLP